jgi:peptidoglycan hydrolase-like protein with peptidoglycan-binding domain
LIQKGAKGYDVRNLQELINKIYQNDDLPVNGTYDKETYAKVIELFKETTALFDAETGAISKQFIHNFNRILANINY